MNCGLGQQGRSLYSSFIYKLKLGFGRFFRGAYKQFWNILLQKDTQVWENNVLMIMGLQAYKTTGDALNLQAWTLYCAMETGIIPEGHFLLRSNCWPIFKAVETDQWDQRMGYYH
jgi:hypothetical protein